MRLPARKWRARQAELRMIESSMLDGVRTCKRTCRQDGQVHSELIILNQGRAHKGPIDFIKHRKELNAETFRGTLHVAPIDVPKVYVPSPKYIPLPRENASTGRKGGLLSPKPTIHICDFLKALELAQVDTIEFGRK